MSTQTNATTRLTLICPNLTCRRTLSAPISARGAVMRCPYCDVPFRVPDETQYPAEGDNNARGKH